jgi:hypothetical protein
MRRPSSLSIVTSLHVRRRRGLGDLGATARDYRPSHQEQRELGAAVVTVEPPQTEARAVESSLTVASAVRASAGHERPRLA